MALTEALNYLKEWAAIYVRHRDSATKKIAEIKNAGFGFAIVNNDGTPTNCIVQPSLEGFNPDAEEIQDNALIVTLNNDKNIQAVYKVWGKLAAKKALMILFVNPFSGIEEKWVLKPHLHNLVCDRNSLLQGLRSMAELVEPIDEETMAAHIKTQVKPTTD